MKVDNNKPKFPTVPLAIMEGHETSFFEAETGAAQALTENNDRQEETESRLLQMFNENTAVIEVKGKLTNKDNWYNKYYGLVSYNEVRAAVIESLELGASSILFDYDTPGGAVAGMRDLSNFIETLDIPTVSFTSSTMASAGLFLGLSSSHGIIADEMSEVGSVGVAMTAIEYSNMLKKEGITARVFRSGKHKQAGNPYEKLSAENVKYIDGQVMHLANKFYEFVSEKTKVPVEYMDEIKTGKTFIGEQALTARLVDRIMSFDQTLIYAADLAEKHLDKTNRADNLYRTAEDNLNNKELSDMPGKKLYSAETLAAMSAGAPAADAGNSNEENTELTAEELAAQEQTNSENEASDTESTEESESVVDGVELIEMTEKYDAAQVELSEAADKISGLEAEIDTLNKAKTAEADVHKEMKNIIVLQVNSMRKAMSLVAVDMKDWATDKIMAEYTSMVKTFESSFPVNGLVPDASDQPDTKPVQTRDDVNAIKVLGF